MKNKEKLIVLVIVLISASLACALPGEEEEEENRAYEDQQRANDIAAFVAGETATAQASITPTITLTPTSTATNTPVPPYVDPAIYDMPVPPGDSFSCSTGEQAEDAAVDIVHLRIYGSNPLASLPPGYWLQVGMGHSPLQTYETCNSCALVATFQISDKSKHTVLINEIHEDEIKLGELDESGQNTVPGTEALTYIDEQFVWFRIPDDAQQLYLQSFNQAIKGQDVGCDHVDWFFLDLPPQ